MRRVRATRTSRATRRGGSMRIGSVLLVVWLVVAPGVVGFESVGVIVGDAVVAGQPASSWLVLVPTSFRVCSSLSVWSSFAIEPSDR